MKPDELQPHPLEPGIEALVATGADTNKLLETIVHQNEKNNPEPILEASVLTQKEILDELRKAPSAELPHGGTVTVVGKQGDKGEKGDKGEIGPVGPPGESIK